MSEAEKLPFSARFSRCSNKLLPISALVTLIFGLAVRSAYGYGFWSELLLTMIPLSAGTILFFLLRWLTGLDALTELPMLSYFGLLICGILMMLLHDFGKAFILLCLPFAVYSMRGRGLAGVLFSFVCSFPLFFIGLLTKDLVFCLSCFVVTMVCLLSAALDGRFGHARTKNTFAAAALPTALGAALLCFFRDGTTVSSFAAVFSPDGSGVGRAVIGVRRLLSGAALWGPGSVSCAEITDAYNVFMFSDSFLIVRTAAESGLIPALLIAAAALLMLISGFYAAMRRQGIYRGLSLGCISIICVHTLLYLFQNFGLYFFSIGFMPFFCGSEMLIEHYMLLAFIMLCPDGENVPRPSGSFSLMREIPTLLNSFTTRLSLLYSNGLVCCMLTLPKQAKFIKKLLCSGDDAISVCTLDVDRAVFGKQLCTVWRFRGAPEELIELLQYVHFDCETAFFRVIGSEVMTAQNINLLTDALTETCSGDALLHFNIGLYDELPPDECTAFIFAL